MQPLILFSLFVLFICNSSSIVAAFRLGGNVISLSKTNIARNPKYSRIQPTEFSLSAKNDKNPVPTENSKEEKKSNPFDAIASAGLAGEENMSFHFQSLCNRSK
jgi:hypothetical protein